MTLPLTTDKVDLYTWTVTEDPDTGNDVKAFTLLKGSVPAAVQQASSTENSTLNQTYREQTATYFNVLVSGALALSDKDQVKWNGKTLVVTGVPAYRSVTDHTSILAALVVG